MSEKKKILLIEDDATLAAMYEHRFRDGDFDVVWHNRGEQVVEKMVAEKPAVVLLDVMLPGDDGFNVLAQIKGDERTMSVPVVLFTNLGQDEDRVKGESLGAAGYLVKASVTPSQIFDYVNKLLNN